MRLRARNPFWRMVLHIVDMGLIKIIRVYIMYGGVVPSEEFDVFGLVTELLVEIIICMGGTEVVQKEGM